MSTRWVAVDVAIGDNPKVWRFASALYPASGRMGDMALAAAVGHLTMLLGAMKIHAPDGRVADVPDDLLELWAKWRGKRGVFARVWRVAFAPDGRLHDWDEWNGRLIRQQEAERQRWHRRSEREHSSGDSAGASAPHSAGDSTGDSAERLPETPPAPNLTIPTNQPPTPKPVRATRRRAASDGSRETWLTPALVAWQRHNGPGSLAPGKAAKLLAPIHAAGVAPDEIGRRLDRYCAARKGARYCTLQDFAEHHAEWASPPPEALVKDGWFTDELERETRPDGLRENPYGALPSGVAS